MNLLVVTVSIWKHMWLFDFSQITVRLVLKHFDGFNSLFHNWIISFLWASIHVSNWELTKRRTFFQTILQFSIIFLFLILLISNSFFIHLLQFLLFLLLPLFLLLLQLLLNSLWTASVVIVNFVCPLCTVHLSFWWFAAATYWSLLW